MIKTQNLLLLCGGKSAEHEISIRSARSVAGGVYTLNESQILIESIKDISQVAELVAFDQLNSDSRILYNLHVVIISRSGTWYWLDNHDDLSKITQCDDVSLYGNICTLIRNVDQTMLIKLAKVGDEQYIQEIGTRIDLVFPVLHGPMGEDGTVQGLLEMMELPYVGSDVLSSAIGMNKRIMKQCFIDSNLPVPAYISGNRDAISQISYKEIIQELDSNIIFVKPATLGSSIGISKVYNEIEYLTAVEMAFKYDKEIIIEKYIECREIECAVLENLEIGDSEFETPVPTASVLGEIIPNHDFYSYEAKYIDPNGAELQIPALIATDIAENIQDLAIKAFMAVRASGMARVDIFIEKKTNQIYINEINTIPGFTSISMYPKLCEESGIAFPILIQKLLETALLKYQTKNALCLYQ